MQQFLQRLTLVLLATGLLTGCTAQAAPISTTYGQHISLQGGSNVQDLGGITTTTGRKIKTHRLIRSNQLAHLTKADTKILTNRYQVKVVADLRAHNEIQAAPDVELANATYNQDSVVTNNQVTSNTLQYYRDLVATPVARRGYTALFHQLLTNRSGALLYHCTYGKDRTGIATMLILSALGVSKKTILKNYLYSNVNLARRSRLAFKDPAKPNQSFKHVTATDLNAAYQEINHQYGSTTNFLRRLGLTPAKQHQLRQMYLTNR